MIDLAITHTLGDFTIDVSLRSDASPLVIMGPSGAGKTLVLRSIAGIFTPAAGHIALGARTLFDAASGINLPPQERRVGYVPQDYALFPNLTVEANIGYGVRGSSQHRRQRIDALIQLVGLAEQRALHPRQLSGGQRQRVAVARALAVEPELLLLDEPFAALDAPTRESLMDQVRRIITSTGTPTVVVTHDRNEALRMADAIAVLMDGRIRQIDTPENVFRAPVDEEVANFVGVETVVRGRVTSLQDGVAHVRVGPHTIFGGTGVSTGDDVLVCVRAEDIVVRAAGQHDAVDSARNHLSARVSSVAAAGPYVRLGLDAGIALTASVTRDAVDELAVAQGSSVVASFKATAVHLIRR
jgi:molybdenum ABC transporter ATP-binding protein